MNQIGPDNHNASNCSVQPCSRPRDCSFFKDGAYYCYCAYVLRVSRYPAFLWVVISNTGIFLRGLKPRGESRTPQVLSGSKKKLGATINFSETIKLQFGKERLYIAVYLKATFPTPPPPPQILAYSDLSGQ